MKLFNIIAILITISAVFSYINHRTVRLPNTIGVMLIALLGSLVLILLGPLSLGLKESTRQLLSSIDFDETLLHGMLSFLLFAGALHIDLSDLYQQRRIISLLATVGVVGSTFIIGAAAWWILGRLGIEASFIFCLLFGSLISPTDPIAVLSILKKAGVPKSLEVKISGESLFNDGVAVVVFLVLLKLASGTEPVSFWSISKLFAVEVVGGIGYGIIIGLFSFWMLKSVDNYQVEILITLALVSGGYALADYLHISGPIAVVVAGLLIGNHGRMLAMSDTTRQHLDMFWELVDEILNAVLFVLIGLEVMVLSFSKAYFTAGVLLIPIVVLSRFISVGIPVAMLRPFRSFSPHVVKILTWGGLRGGISVALALSLPAGTGRDAILFMTYSIVVFSIVFQGLTIGKLVRAFR
ncbi:MAG TPA: sodium:proton antiporter [Deltaproteobacteria bacterium]|nr:sodium:proton antiporter [Deltaproteobacteria bacterium]